MEMDGKEMDGKVAVVTGASMGIGEAIAKVFVDQGARVVLLSREATPTALWPRLAMFAIAKTSTARSL
jgi:NADP-dependent 3-hydroxy acid dehydrogenase YdfG